MKVKIGKDEIYGMVLSNYGDDVEVKEHTLKRWARITNEFSDMQAEMQDVWDAQHPPAHDDTRVIHASRIVNPINPVKILI